MLDQLPTELVRHILELATAGDRGTCIQLCGVNRAVQAVVLPILYKHVFLSSTAQVDMLNTTLTSSPKLGQLIYGMTLCDEAHVEMELHLLHDALHQESQKHRGWFKQWNRLIHHLGELSRKQNLSVLVLSREVCQRFVYNKEGGQFGPLQPLVKQLEKCNIQLDTLVVSHADLDFFLCHIRAKKVIWYGCEYLFDAMAFFSLVQASKQPRLESIALMLSDNYNRTIQGEAGNDEEVAEEIYDTDTLWRYLYVRCCRYFRSKKAEGKKAAKITVSFHVNTQGARKHFEERVKSLNGRVQVGIWGSPNDPSQGIAEMKNLVSRGWVQQESVVIPSNGAEGPSEVTDQTEVHWISADGWSMKTPPRNQWCDCELWPEDCPLIFDDIDGIYDEEPNDFSTEEEHDREEAA